MKKIKTLLIAILYVLLFLIINFGVITIFTLGYNIFSNLDINTNAYIESLAIFLNKNKIFITLASIICWFPILYQKIRKQNLKFDIHWNHKYLNFILLGLSISVVLNIIMFDIGIQKIANGSFLSISSIISVAIIGPILEELVFRGIVYNKLKDNFKIGSSILLVSLLFGLFHLNLIQGLYAFLLSIIITYCYEKSNNLFVPILIHCSANMSINLLIPYLSQVSFTYLQVILFLFIVLVCCCLFKLKKNIC